MRKLLQDVELPGHDFCASLLRRPHLVIVVVPGSGLLDDLACQLLASLLIVSNVHFCIPTEAEDTLRESIARREDLAFCSLARI